MPIIRLQDSKHAFIATVITLALLTGVPVNAQVMKRTGFRLAAIQTPEPAVASMMETVIHNFQYSENGPDGVNPVARLVSDTEGNLYGTTSGGGAYGYGTVYELSPQRNGTWVETVLYSFGSQSGDGTNPTAGLVLDKAGNLYGSTNENGGSGCPIGCGTAFELSPQPTGSWTETVLYEFRGGLDGYDSYGSFILDASGNLYGTAMQGGSGSCDSYYGVGCGTVFELSRQPNGQWTETVLYSFQSNSQDGAYPASGLTFDAAGSLYGTTIAGGSGTAPACHSIGCGIVFELRSQGGGSWVESVLHSFDVADGARPLAPIILDAAGNLYGTTLVGGSGTCPQHCGIVFELIPQTGGAWTETVLHSFKNNGDDGVNPQSALLFGKTGHLYGTTSAGGAGSCEILGLTGCGAVFELSPISGGGWEEGVLYNFQGFPVDGEYPVAGLVFGKMGGLLGTTEYGGSEVVCEYGCGTAFEITP